MVSPLYMKRYYSGSGSSGNPIGSLGGAITANEIGNSVVNAVWDDTTTTEAQVGDTEYRCFYFKWTAPEVISNVVIFLSSKAHGPQDSVFLGKGTSVKNGVEQTIANESAIPTGVAFDNPGNRAEGITIASSMSQGEWQAIWLKRTIDQGAAVLALEDYEIEVQFDAPSGGTGPPPPNPPPGGDVGTYEHSFFGDDDCGGDHVKNVTNVKNRGVILHLTLGDYSYQDTATCWISDMTPIKDKIKFITMGNHEVEEGVPSALKTTYMNWVGQSQQWASYVYRNQHYLVLSEFADYSVGSAQYNFALQKLQQYANDPNIDWRFVLFHEPMYTNPGHHDIDDDGDSDFRDIYHPLFDQYNVDVMFSGHNHNYERSYPLTYNGGTTPTRASTETTNYVSPFDGVIQIICGTGGTGIYPIDSKASFFVTGAGSEFETHGYGILEFSNNDKVLKIKWYNVNNVLVDPGCTISKAASTGGGGGAYRWTPYQSFNGNQRIEVPYEAKFQLSSFTLAAWFRTSHNYAGAEGQIAIKGQGSGSPGAGHYINYNLKLNNDPYANELECNFLSSDEAYHAVFTDGLTWNDGNWHFACVTYDQVNEILYCDGVERNRLATSATPDVGTDPFTIGAEPVAASEDHFWFGDIDEVRVWNRALSPSEHTQLYLNNIVPQNGLIYENTFGNEGGEQTGGYHFEPYGTFAGDADIIDIAEPTAPDLPASWSIACWFKTSFDYYHDGIGYGYLISKGDFASETINYTLLISSDLDPPHHALEVAYSRGGGYIEGAWGGSGQENGPYVNICDGNWHHAVGTYNSSDKHLKIYLDGFMDFDRPPSGSYTVPQTSEPLHVGGLYGAAFIGNLDEMRVWNVVLTQAEVSDLYNLGVVPKTANIVYENLFAGATSGYHYSPYGTYNGTSDITTITDAANLRLTQWAVACWFKTSKDNADDTATMVQKGEFLSETSGTNINYELSIIDPTNQVITGFETSAGADHFAVSPLAYNDNNWHLAVGTYDMVTVRLYIDGYEKATHSTTATPDNNAGYDLHLGAEKSDHGFYQGNLDEVRIWNTPLTAVEIAYYYNNGVVPKTGNIVYQNTF